MKEKFLKTREGLKYLLEIFPSDIPVSIAIKKATNTYKLKNQNGYKTI